MFPERVKHLDRDIIDFFARKGLEERRDLQINNRNGVKVRRIIQVMRDLVRQPEKELSVLYQHFVTLRLTKAAQQRPTP